MTTSNDSYDDIDCRAQMLKLLIFVISRIIEVSVRVISLSPRLRLITHTSTSIILDITKTSSNNCLVAHCVRFFQLQDCLAALSKIFWYEYWTLYDLV